MSDQPDTAAPIDGATLERIMHEALRRGDVKGVHAALSVMATTDPRRAERLLGTLQDALAVARIVNGEDPEWWHDYDLTGIHKDPATGGVT